MMTTQFITAFPNSGMHPTLGAFIFTTGTGVAGFSGNIDSVSIGFTGPPTVYDFESIGTTTTVSLWDSGDLLATVDTAGNRIEEYTDYPGDVDTPHSVRRWSGGTSTMYYYPLEFPGHAMGLIDTTGAVVNWYKYGPFGAMQDSIVGVPNALRFGARELDVSGLYYFRARYYDPGLERFVQEDPIGIAGGLNTYGFGGDDPVNSRDPSAWHALGLLRVYTL